MGGIGEGSVMPIVSAVLVILGFVVFFSDAFFRTPEAPPIASLNPRHWKPIWTREYRKWVRPPGYFLTIAGWIMFSIGIGLRWLFVGWPW